MDSLNMSGQNVSDGSGSSTSTGITANHEVVQVHPRTETDFPVLDEQYHCEYRDDIWKFLLEQNDKKRVLSLKPPQLVMREGIVRRLRMFCTTLRLRKAALHTAVFLLDSFMDTYILSSNQLIQVAVGCLSLAAKSEEHYRRAPKLRTLEIVSGIQFEGEVFKQLEWTIAQHVEWRLLTPTAATFADLLSPYVVTKCDMISKNPTFVKKIKRDGAVLLDSYLDLCLLDSKFISLSSVDVACACVACARDDLGLVAWPHWLAAITTRDADTVATIAKKLQKKQINLQFPKIPAETKVDQVYFSAGTTTKITPSAPPPTSNTTTSTNDMNLDTSYRFLSIVRNECIYTTAAMSGVRNNEYNAHGVGSNTMRTVNRINYFTQTSNFDMSRPKVVIPAGNKCGKLDPRINTVEGPPHAAVKRCMVAKGEVERKRYCMGNQ